MVFYFPGWLRYAKDRDEDRPVDKTWGLYSWLFHFSFDCFCCWTRYGRAGAKWFDTVYLGYLLRESNRALMRRLLVARSLLPWSYSITHTLGSTDHCLRSDQQNSTQAFSLCLPSAAIQTRPLYYTLLAMCPDWRVVETQSIEGQNRPRRSRVAPTATTTTTTTTTTTKTTTIRGHKRATAGISSCEQPGTHGSPGMGMRSSAALSIIPWTIPPLVSFSDYISKYLFEASPPLRPSNNSLLTWPAGGFAATLPSLILLCHFFVVLCFSTVHAYLPLHVSRCYWKLFYYTPARQLLNKQTDKKFIDLLFSDFRWLLINHLAENR